MKNPTHLVQKEIKVFKTFKLSKNATKIWSYLPHSFDVIITSYMTDSYIVFTFKMEFVSKNTIFGLKMMVKIGLEKFILESLHAGR